MTASFETTRNFKKWDEIHGGDQQNWQRKQIPLNDEQLFSVKCKLSANSSGIWSYRQLSYEAIQQQNPHGWTPIDPIYLFIFENEHDLDIVNA